MLYEDVFMRRNRMVPLSGTRVYSMFRVVDVDVAPCGHAVRQRRRGGAALGRTFGAITFFNGC